VFPNQAGPGLGSRVLVARYVRNGGVKLFMATNPNHFRINDGFVQSFLVQLILRCEF
jgi:hypothetical protein